MNKQILAIGGLSGSGKNDLIELFQNEKKDLKIIFLSELESQLLQFGEEGYRQIINYFGEAYLKKDGQLNLNKLWKFVYGDQHKLKILDFMFKPLLLNQVQKKLDMLDGLILIVGIDFKLEGLNKIFSKKIWVINSDENILKNLSLKKLPISPEKYLQVQQKLYGLNAVKDYYLFNNSDIGQRENEWLKLKQALNI